MPGAAIAVHTFGDFLQFNPHLHIIATDGCFSSSGAFTVGRGSVGRDLEELFRHEVLKMLKVEGKITDAVIENMLSWHHSGYSNKSRGMRKKAGGDDQVPALVESSVSSAAFRKNWARLIQKIYQSVEPT